MTAALDRIKYLASLPFEKYLDEAVVEHEAELTDLNRKQLDQGVDSEGNSLGEYKNFDYKGRYKPVDLDNTHAFRNSFDTKPFGKGFNIVASDPKTEYLKDQYSDDILGISDENKTHAGEILAPELSDKIRAAL